MTDPIVTAELDPERIYTRVPDPTGRVKLPSEYAGNDQVTVAVLRGGSEDAPRDAEHHNAPKDGNDDPVFPDTEQVESARETGVGRCPECGSSNVITSLGGESECIDCGESFEVSGE